MDHFQTSKSLVAQRFARSTPTYNGEAVVQRDMARRLVLLIRHVTQARSLQGRAGRPVGRGLDAAKLEHAELEHTDFEHTELEHTDFEQVLELGCGTGLLTDLLVQQLTIGKLVLNDIVPDLECVASRCHSTCPSLDIELCPGDMESIRLPSNQHLVTSSAVLQWAVDPTAMLQKMVKAVAPGGLLAVATFGPRNLTETSDLTGTSLNYLSLDTIQATLDEHADVLESHEQIQTVSFKTAYAVLQHLKRTGVNGVRQTRWSPGAVREFCHTYETRFGTGGSVPLTYHPILVVARRRERAFGEGW